MKTVTPLTDTQIRKAKPNCLKPTYLYDGGGLYLEICPKGSKGWRFTYTFQGKRKLMSFGKYPEVTLAGARVRREEARKLLADNVDPLEHRKAKRAAGEESEANCFEVVAREWLAVRKTPSCAPGHVAHIQSYFDKDIFPWLGKRPITEIAAPELISIARRVESRGAIATAHRVISVCGEVFRFAVSSGRATSDPTRDLKNNLQKIPKAKHRAATTDPKRIGEILRMISGYQGGIIVRSALLLAPLTFVRPGELRAAEWKDINFDEHEWRFVATKTDVDHIVPLSRQAEEILRDLQPVTGSQRYVFTNPKTTVRPMSENAVLAALRTMGIPKEEMCGHGWRAVARTLLDEKLGFPIPVIEKQLAHKVKDLHGEAYNRTAFLAERRKMMQQWADYLDQLRFGESATPQEKR